MDAGHRKMLNTPNVCKLVPLLTLVFATVFGQNVPLLNVILISSGEEGLTTPKGAPKL